MLHSKRTTLTHSNVKPRGRAKKPAADSLGREVDVVLEGEDGDVVDQVSGVILRVDEERGGPELDVAEELGVGADVPLAQADSQLRQLQLTDAVGGGEEVAVVDERGAAHVHDLALFLPEDGRLPRVFAELCVALHERRVLDAAEHALCLTVSACGQVAGLRLDGVAAAHLVEAAAASAWEGAEAVALERRET